MEKIILNEREYNIEKLLGKGKGGYSYLVNRDGMQYVIKKIHHEPCAYYTFGDKLQSEIDDYKTLSKVGLRIPKMLDVDVENELILKEFIKGDTIYDMVLNDENVDKYLVQVKEMCRILYPQKINIDYFPTNFVVQDDLIYYIDFECNKYMDEWNFENWGIKYWSKTTEFLKYVSEH